jgi:hypothetical protein
MRGTWRKSTVASLLFSIAFYANFANAGVVVPRASPTDIWVKVAADGSAQTITPIVTVEGGATKTISPYPGPTGTGTGTSVAPATATSTDGAGFFRACDNRNGYRAPFCDPAQGSQIEVGKTYYCKLQDTLEHWSKQPRCLLLAK